jgi:NAD(P)-dependent dehydrogenase (short-subunit alcohol dehydrogenase family)
MGRLAGKVAIITGAARGQGASEAELFVKEGAKVVITDMLEDEVKQVADTLNAQFGDVALGFKQNVAEETEWQETISKTVAKFGKVDVLVNNAGITGNTPKKPEGYALSEYEKVMAVNATSNFLGIKYVVPEMKKIGGGSIINISSLAGIVGMGGFSGYSASKGATRLLTKGAAVSLGADHIRVNSVHPGFIETPMISDYTDNADIKKGIEAKIPLGYMGKPEDVAYAVVFLASDEARFVDGAELIIDGAQSQNV